VLSAAKLRAPADADANLKAPSGDGAEGLREAPLEQAKLIGFKLT
jgi:hypothetical protein